MRWTPVPERLERLSRDEGECRLWIGAQTKHGYGMLGIGRKTVLAHRVAYQLAHGPVPDGLELDHVCRNRSCINPAHAVTRRENALRGAATKLSDAEVAALVERFRGSGLSKRAFMRAAGGDYPVHPDYLRHLLAQGRGGIARA